MTCPICGSGTNRVILLPGFIGGDQSVDQCLECGHGTLAMQHPQDSAYTSAGTDFSRQGVYWFQSHLRGHFRCALDFGCNDGMLLRCVTADRKIGVDLYETPPDVEAHTSLDTVDAAPDLVMCRHTLEHLADPVTALKSMVAKAAPNAVFALEVPAFDRIVDRLRFDHVHNGHYQYFSLKSFQRMCRIVGLQTHTWMFNPSMLSMFAMCIRGEDYSPEVDGAMPDIQRNYAAFKTYAEAIGNAFMTAKTRYAYGASSAFPVLMYHLGLDASLLEAVIDDNPTLRGTTFHGRTVIAPNTVTKGTALVTAPQSFAAIYARAHKTMNLVSGVPII
jgi:hypothetical protein